MDPEAYAKKNEQELKEHMDQYEDEVFMKQMTEIAEELEKHPFVVIDKENTEYDEQAMDQELAVLKELDKAD